MIKSVCPALGIVSYNVLAYSRPLMKILGRIRAVFIAVLDRRAEAVENFRSCLKGIQRIFVRRLENVRFRVFTGEGRVRKEAMP